MSQGASLVRDLAMGPCLQRTVTNAAPRT